MKSLVVLIKSPVNVQTDGGFLYRIGNDTLQIDYITSLKQQSNMAPANDAIDISKLQKEIEAYLNLGSTSVVFEFEEHNGKMRLNVVTVNPRHNQSFLFQSIQGYDKKDCLKQMLSYVKTSRDKENSYTIQWSAKGTNELQTSYFRAKDIPEALDKLFFGRDPNSLTIFSVVLNPIA